MSDKGWNIWGAIAGVLGILIAVYPFCSMWLRSRLPSRNLPALVALLEETKIRFEAARQEGLFTDASDLRRYDLNILTAAIFVDEFSAEVHCKSSYTHDVMNWWRGMTNRITTLHKELNIIRVRLAKKNSEERKKRIPENFIADFSLRSETKGGDASSPPTPLISTPPSALPPSATPPSALPPSVAMQANQPGHRAVCSDFDAQETETVPYHSSEDTDEVAGNATEPAAPPPSGNSPDQQPSPHIQENPALARGPSYDDIISDADLHGLLSRVLAHGKEGRRPTTRREVLLYLSKQLDEAGLDGLPPLGVSMRPKRGVRHGACLKAFKRLLQQAAGVRPPKVGRGVAIHLDPESLLPKYAEDQDSGEEWDED